MVDTVTTESTIPEGFDVRDVLAVDTSKYELLFRQLSSCYMDLKRPNAVHLLPLKTLHQPDFSPLNHGGLHHPQEFIAICFENGMRSCMCNNSVIQDWPQTIRSGVAL